MYARLERCASNCFVWNPKRELLGTGSKDGFLTVWNLEQNQPQFTFEEDIEEDQRKSEVICLDWKSDGSLLAVGIIDHVQKRGFVRIFDLNGDSKYERIKTANKITSLKWNRDGNYLFVGSHGSCIVWKLEEDAKVKLKDFRLTGTRNNLADWSSVDTFAVVNRKNVNVFIVNSATPILSFNGHFEITSIRRIAGNWFFGRNSKGLEYNAEMLSFQRSPQAY